jgi:hypothetical protein
MNRAVIPIYARDVITLTTGAQTENDPVQHAPAINPVSPSDLSGSPCPRVWDGFDPLNVVTTLGILIKVT